MQKTTFEITKMDCPSEENLIRMKLDEISSIANLDFDIPNRKLTVFHSGEIDQIEQSILELNLRGKKLSTEKTEQTNFEENSNQKKLLLKITLLILKKLLMICFIQNSSKLLNVKVMKYYAS